MRHSGTTPRATRLAVFQALQPRFDVRNVMSRSGQTLRGRIACAQGGGSVPTESWWEGLFALRAQASAAVTWFETQPLRFPVQFAAISGRYTPDAAVGLLSGESALVEVKRVQELQSADTLAWLTAVRQDIGRNGFRLLISTDEQLRRPEENARIRRVKIHRCIFLPRETDALDARLGERSTLLLGEAVSIVGMRAALHLIAVKRWFVDYRRPLDAALPLSRHPEEATHAVELFHGW